MKFLEEKDKEKILKVLKQKRHITFKGATIGLKIDRYKEILETEENRLISLRC